MYVSSVFVMGGDCHHDDHHEKHHDKHRRHHHDDCRHDCYDFSYYYRDCYDCYHGGLLGLGIL
jgi:hypothetical protein